MKKEWESTVITAVGGAVYVPAGAGKSVHENRPYHGFVINDSEGAKDYYFSDGRVMRTEAGCLFYLPKGSSYSVKTVEAGGCFAINFDADISDEPFARYPKDCEKLRKSFKAAADEWKKQSPLWRPAAMRAVYDVIYALRREGESYVTEATVNKILPAINILDERFADSDVTVAMLAEVCGVSEVYFRRIFEKRFKMSPKEYMIRKRIEYAKQLLASGQVSVAETAAICGYGEPCHFSREFKRRTGMAPKEYK